MTGTSEQGTPTNSTEAYAAIAKLPPKQRDVLAQIAMNNDGGHHPATLDALLRRGLIDCQYQTLGGRFPVRIKRYDVPTFVHIAWCYWCEQHVAEDE